MKFISTRARASGIQEPLTVSEAMRKGLASDGGLFVPEFFPKIEWKHLDKSMSYPEFAHHALAPYFKGDELEGTLARICKECFTFELPVKHVNQNTFVLELFHGPTLSFKDFGARFLGTSLSHMKREKVMTIIVATSGDTGSAVAAALHNKKNIRVVVMFPEGKISARQQKQITCWGDNVLAIAVKGAFDDCQALVKGAFADQWWHEVTELNTSNSINIGRLLPQSTYYAYTSWQYYLAHNQPANFVVPSGNIGNVTAAYWAKECGFPIGEIVVSQNENNTLVNYLKTGVTPDQPTIETLANAMDVGKPSNFERLAYLHSDFDVFRERVKAYEVTDENIKKQIIKTYQQDDYLACPHTATTFFARESLDDKDWILVATADPCKFETVLEPIINKTVPPTDQLQYLLDKRGHFERIQPEMKALKDAYMHFYN